MRYPVLYSSEDQCCGCTACAAICPREAIDFEYNKEGFLYPRVNESKCVQCLQCEEICAFRKNQATAPDEETTVFGVKHKCDGVRRQSSSGGLFTALSDHYLNNGNAVASCVYSRESDAVHMVIYEDPATRDEARGSKYIQAELNDSFRKIKRWLVEHPQKNLMVVGTGCQIAGLERYLCKIGLRDRVLLVDLICHGAPSSGLWKAYIRGLKGSRSLDWLTFKDKKIGWHYPRTFAVIDGKEEKINRYSDWFYMGLSLRESCYCCPFTRISRSSDITIGDYWGIEDVKPEFADKHGVSLALVHTQRGQAAFDQIKDDVIWFQSDVNACFQPRLQAPEKRPSNRDAFWQDMQTYGIPFCSRKYRRPDHIGQYQSMVSTVKAAVKRIIKGL